MVARGLPRHFWADLSHLCMTASWPAFIGGAAFARFLNMPIWISVVLALIGVFLGYSIKMAQQWERAVILRLGKLQAVKGPGLFILIPILDAVATWIDQRIRTTEVNAEQALTRDTVPVNVDAIVFWMVHDPERAALEITDYVSAVQRVAQTSLREMIGSSGALATTSSSAEMGPIPYSAAVPQI